VPEKQGVKRSTLVLSSQVSNRTDMGSRTGLEAEAINRLTDGVQPPVMRAILVQCLAGNIAPSAAISRMLAEGSLPTVRAAIDDVTERAASISRASDMLVHDRVDELTQIFVENVAALADVNDATKISSAAKEARQSRSARSLESRDRGEPRTSE
jgi:hypothetical protein